MRERDIENWLVRQVRQAGGMCWKLTSPGSSGVPDRLVILPGGRIWFVELKAEDGVLSSIQDYQIRQMLGRGCRAVVLRGMDEVKAWVAKEVERNALPTA